MRVAENHRPPGGDEVDVVVAIDIRQMATLRRGDETRSAADRRERAHGRIDPTGRRILGPTEQFSGTGCDLSGTPHGLQCSKPQRSATIRPGQAAHARGSRCNRAAPGWRNSPGRRPQTTYTIRSPARGHDNNCRDAPLTSQLCTHPSTGGCRFCVACAGSAGDVPVMRGGRGSAEPRARELRPRRGPQSAYTIRSSARGHDNNCLGAPLTSQLCTEPASAGFSIP
ncbi:Uncharacterised protein [Mycobacteroides abscessus subsp. abscessus]|nr:Uncharacterised protein [Mycobacteroides abscessus subsp. abscessus]